MAANSFAKAGVIPSIGIRQIARPRPSPVIARLSAQPRGGSARILECPSPAHRRTSSQAPPNNGLHQTGRAGVPASRAVVRVAPCKATLVASVRQAKGAVQQRIGTDEVHADGRGPSPRNSVFDRRLESETATARQQSRSAPRSASPVQRSLRARGDGRCALQRASLPD